MTRDDMIKAIEEMTVLELSELVKAIPLNNRQTAGGSRLFLWPPAFQLAAFKGQKPLLLQGLPPRRVGGNPQLPTPGYDACSGRIAVVDERPIEVKKHCAIRVQHGSQCSLCDASYRDRGEVDKLQ